MRQAEHGRRQRLFQWGGQEVPKSSNAISKVALFNPVLINYALGSRSRWFVCDLEGTVAER